MHQTFCNFSGHVLAPFQRFDNYIRRICILFTAAGKYTCLAELQYMILRLGVVSIVVSARTMAEECDLFFPCGRHPCGQRFSLSNSGAIY